MEREEGSHALDPFCSPNAPPGAGAPSLVFGSCLRKAHCEEESRARGKRYKEQKREIDR